MTTGCGARAWGNDYGDIPSWYWVPRTTLLRASARRVNRDGARGGHAAIAMLCALGCP